MALVGRACKRENEIGRWEKTDGNPRVLLCCRLVTKSGPTLFMTTPWTVALQAPLFMGKNTGVGCHFLLQGIFLSEELNHISCIAGGLFTTEPPGKPFQLKSMNSNLRLTVRGFPEISYVSLEDLLSHCASYFIPSLPSYVSNSLLFLHFQRVTPSHAGGRRGRRQRQPGVWRGKPGPAGCRGLPG